MKIASSLFGKEKLNSWMDKGLDIEQLSQLIQWAMKVYSGAEITEKEGNVATEKNKELSKEGEESVGSESPLHILENWSLIESDFKREYNINLVDEFDTISWRQFRAYLKGLSPNSAYASLLVNEQYKNNPQGASQEKVKVIEDAQEAEKYLDSIL